MKLEPAQQIASRIEDKLAPHCYVIEIAGSLRRKKPDVHDIEIVAIPEGDRQEGLFEDPFSKKVNSLGRIVKGRPQGKYCKIELPEGIGLDLFLANFTNWGYIYMLRTGSDNFNRRILLPRLKERGFKLEGGYIWMGGMKVATENEEFIFKLMDLNYIKPENRH